VQSFFNGVAILRLRRELCWIRGKGNQGARMAAQSMTNAMNHGWLFTLLCALILFSIRFYKKEDWKSA
jgi:hypothetical protein